jgi:hypothetical protein
VLKGKGNDLRLKAAMQEECAYVCREAWTHEELNANSNGTGWISTHDRMDMKN